MNSSEILATLVTNVPAPRIHAAFTLGSEKAQDRLSIPVRARLDPRDRITDSRIFQLFCVVGLVGLIEEEPQIDALITAALDEASCREDSYALLVAFPSDTLNATAYFKEKVDSRPCPPRPSLDGIEAIDLLSDITETFVVVSANQRLPPSRSIDRTQVAVYEGAAFENKTSTDGMIIMPWSLS